MTDLENTIWKVMTDDRYRNYRDGGMKRGIDWHDLIEAVWMVICVFGVGAAIGYIIYPVL